MKSKMSMYSNCKLIFAVLRDFKYVSFSKLTSWSQRKDDTWIYQMLLDSFSKLIWTCRGAVSEIISDAVETKPLVFCYWNNTAPMHMVALEFISLVFLHLNFFLKTILITSNLNKPSVCISLTATKYFLNCLWKQRTLTWDWISVSAIKLQFNKYIGHFKILQGLVH